MRHVRNSGGIMKMTVVVYLKSVVVDFNAIYFSFSYECKNIDQLLLGIILHIYLLILHYKSSALC